MNTKSNHGISSLACLQVAALCAFLQAAQACMPAVPAVGPSPLLARQYSLGKLSYSLHGKTIDENRWGSGLVRVAREFPEARDSAQSYRRMKTTSTLLNMTAIACGVAVFFVSRKTEDSDALVTPVRLAVFGCVSLLTGSSYANGRGLMHQQAAINLINEALLKSRASSPDHPLMPLPLVRPASKEAERVRTDKRGDDRLPEGGSTQDR